MFLNMFNSFTSNIPTAVYYHVNSRSEGAKKWSYVFMNELDYQNLKYLYMKHQFHAFQ